MIACVEYVLTVPRKQRLGSSSAILLIFVLDPIYGLNELPEVYCEFAFNRLACPQWLFQQVNHGAYYQIMTHRRLFQAER